MALSRPATSVTIPASILDAVLPALRAHGDTTAVHRVQRVRGGFESTSVRLTTRRRDYFLKWSGSAQGSFQAEAANLALLAATGAVAVPTVLWAVDPARPVADGERQARCDAPGFLLMEWLTPPSREVFQRRVGRELGTAVARMHMAHAIGDVPIGGYGPAGAIHDAAAWRADWVAYYREELLRPQIELAARTARLSAESCARLDRLLDRLEQWLVHA